MDLQKEEQDLVEKWKLQVLHLLVLHWDLILVVEVVVAAVAVVVVVVLIMRIRK